MKRLGRQEEFDCKRGMSDEDIKDMLVSKLSLIFHALARDIVEQGLKFPIAIALKYERQNMNQRFQAFAETLEDASPIHHSNASLISDKEIEKKIAHYEKLFGISSDEFLQQMGTMEDSFETMDWMILLRHR